MEINFEQGMKTFIPGTKLVETVRLVWDEFDCALCQIDIQIYQ